MPDYQRASRKWSAGVTDGAVLERHVSATLHQVFTSFCGLDILGENLSEHSVTATIEFLLPSSVPSGLCGEQQFLLVNSRSHRAMTLDDVHLFVPGR
jgi:hypothetical protein